VDEFSQVSRAQSGLACNRFDAAAADSRTNYGTYNGQTIQAQQRYNVYEGGMPSK
jgi:hypothetical protein